MGRKRIISNKEHVLLIACILMCLFFIFCSSNHGFYAYPLLIAVLLYYVLQIYLFFRKKNRKTFSVNEKTEKKVGRN